MLNKCVVCPYRLGTVKTLVNPCLQCSAELIKGRTDSDSDKKNSNEKK